MPLPKPCLDCGAPTRNGTRCPTHQAQADTQREAVRPRRQSRGYNAEHERRAAALRAKGLPCSLCGAPIMYNLRSPHPASFAAHHLTKDKRGPLAPAHRLCNELAGAPTF